MAEPSAGARLHKPVWIVFLLLAAILAIKHFIGSSDYVGADNDDVMRLIEVRDLLSGQNWFDLTQYRLGLDGGTLMHWSRLIDAPIAGLILLFGLFLDPLPAEATALFIWPLLTTLPLLYAVAAGARALAPRAHAGSACMIALILTSLFVISLSKFRPGAIDHHNVQIALMAVIVTVLVQRSYSTGGYALAGFAAAVAIAIGAETTPSVAVACAAVAGIWLFEPEVSRKAVNAFALTMAASLTAIFYLTVPPAQYGAVTCDSLSTGFYALGVIGAGGLFLVSATLSGKSLAPRLLGLAAIGGATAAAAVMIAPQCLGSPLANLDPLLVELWLNFVTEARSAKSMFISNAWTAPAYYAVPLIAMAVIVREILKGRGVRQQIVLLAAIGSAFLISLVQVRGSIFANLFALFALAPVIAEARAIYRENPARQVAGLKFAALALLSVQLIWIAGGEGLATAFGGHNDKSAATDADAKRLACTDEAAIAPLAGEALGVVSEASNLGAYILRFTRHRVLSAPYHRNQAGMLAELRIGMAEPDQAHALLNAAGVTLVAFCASDPQVELVSGRAPDGFYAALGKGDIPAYLDRVKTPDGSPLEIFRVKP